METPPDSSPGRPARPCLLLVDDTPSNIDILVGLLKSDFDLKVAGRGEKALEIIASGVRIDLVLLDVMMPEMDGYEVCRRIRAAPASIDLPVIFLTAKSGVDDVVLGLDVGAQDYLAKPFRAPELLARVRTQLTLSAQRQEIARRNTELKEMLHIVCHDVANQLFVASMSLELMAASPQEDRALLVGRAMAAVKNGIGLTNLVREMRKMEDKGLELASVSLRECADQAGALAEGRLQAKHLTLTVQGNSARIRAEVFSLTNSVIGNLLSNAIKFSREGDAISLEIRDEGDEAVLVVRDHGLGMPPDVLETLFDVSKSHSRTGTAGERGTGFGMPLMAKFVRMYGGRISVVTHDAESHPGDHGTEFTLHLPHA